MAYKLISVDNPHTVGNDFINRISHIVLDGRIFLFDTLHSSLIKTIEKDDKFLKIQTLNTLYIFEAV